MMKEQPTTVFAVRHGETEWNSTGRQQGHLDSLLTHTGVEQAYALANGLVGKQIEILFSSDLGRAHMTATIIADRLNLEINVNERLRERHLGCMQGLTKEEFRKRYPNEWSAFISGDPAYCFPNGESARQRYERTVACVEELAQAYSGRRILVVTHGGVLDGFFRRAIGIPLSEPRRFSLFNTAINSFSLSEHGWFLETWGETRHLQGINTLDDN